ncbi:MAG: copper chaperone PCu(A)C [Pseudomonadota bacterium]
MQAKNVLKSLWFGMLLLTPLFTGAEEETALPITVEEAWVRAMPPTMRMTAAYLKIQNNGDMALKLMGAASPRFGLVEIHQSFEKDGVARMRELEAVEIAPGASVALEPGGKHIMLMKLQGKLSRGDKVALELHFEGGAVHQLEALVK